MSGLVLAAGLVPVAIVRDADFTSASAALRAAWQADVKDGVPASSLAPLEHELSSYRTPGLVGIGWWANQPATEIASLQRRTAGIRQAAVAAARAQVDAELTTARGLLASMDPSSGQAWQQHLDEVRRDEAHASTPAAITALLAPLRQAEQTQQAATSAARLAAGGGLAGMTATVHGLDTAAATRNLDTAGMDSALAGLTAEEAKGTVDPQATTALLHAVTAEQAAIALNDRIGTEIRPLLYQIDEASLLGAAGAAAMQSTYAPLPSAWTAARTEPELSAVEATIEALQQQSTTAIAGSSCGHGGSGRSILVSLSLQELVAFQDGCVVKATPVTTGRPALPTPAGSFSVFFKTSPWEMVSSWPYGSPFWYPPTWVSQVMEFDQGGYFLHDASWEPVSDYGPGGEYNDAAASHGCIHVPTPTMQWLYSWTPVGTPVTVIP
ncbi:MAG TPA: L,D-transpeptidase [Candidatus Dormibacteraeota bacterium]